MKSSYKAVELLTETAIKKIDVSELSPGSTQISRIWGQLETIFISPDPILSVETPDSRAKLALAKNLFSASASDPLPAPFSPYLQGVKHALFASLPSPGQRDLSIRAPKGLLVQRNRGPKRLHHFPPTGGSAPTVADLAARPGSVLVPYTLGADKRLQNRPEPRNLDFRPEENPSKGFSLEPNSGPTPTEGTQTPSTLSNAPCGPSSPSHGDDCHSTPAWPADRRYGALSPITAPIHGRDFTSTPIPLKFQGVQVFPLRGENTGGSAKLILRWPTPLTWLSCAITPNAAKPIKSAVPISGPFLTLWDGSRSETGSPRATPRRGVAGGWEYKTTSAEQFAYLTRPRVCILVAGPVALAGKSSGDDLVALAEKESGKSSVQSHGQGKPLNLDCVMDAGLTMPAGLSISVQGAPDDSLSLSVDSLALAVEHAAVLLQPGRTNAVTGLICALWLALVQECQRTGTLPAIWGTARVPVPERYRSLLRARNQLQKGEDVKRTTFSKVNPKLEYTSPKEANFYIASDKPLIDMGLTD